MTKQLIRLLIFLFIFISPVFSGDVHAADAYGRIMTAKQIRIGISLHYPPLNFDGGKDGVEIVMARKLGEFLGVKVELVPLKVSEYVSALEKNRVDIIIAGFSRNLERGRVIWFSDPYLSVTPGVLVNKRSLPQRKFGEEFEESPLNTIWDLKTMKRFTLAVKKGSSYEALLGEYFPSMSTVLVESNEEGLELVDQGKADGFVHDSLYLQYVYNTSGKYRGSCRLLQGGKQAEAICVGLPFGDTVLKNQVDLFIAELVRQGLIEEWLNNYSSR